MHVTAENNPIQTKKDLEEHLQWALTLELTTIPPYLCALYSIPDGSNDLAAGIIRSVVMEEMLHTTLAANLLNSIGGKPRLNKAKHIPSYPGRLPHSSPDLKEVSLLPFSPAAIDTFLMIEQPSKPDAPPEPDRFHTIGQFYHAIEEAFCRLSDCGEKGKGGEDLFLPREENTNQVTGDTWYYGGGGAPIGVYDFESAQQAIQEIAEQGEGAHDSIFDDDDDFGEPEIAHYFRFMEIKLGRMYRDTDTPNGGPTGPELPVDWEAVYPMAPNPKSADYRDRKDVYELMTRFNESYTGLLEALHEAFNGEQNKLLEAVPIMYQLKYQAQALMQIPTGADDGSTVGPPFEFVD